MPIRPSTRHLYPANWRSIARGVKQRAGWRCEKCGAPHLAWGFRGRRGFGEISEAEAARRGYGRPPFRMAFSGGGSVLVVRIVLAAAHLDHDPGNCDPANLRALCQLCHLAHDERQHVTNARATRRRAMRTGELPLA